MHPFSKVQQAMLEEEKWSAPSMTYFRPHFMMPPGSEAAGHQANPGPPAAAGAYEKLQRGQSSSQPWWLNYDQALDLGQNSQQNGANKPPQMPQQNGGVKPPQMPQQKVIKHEQVDHQARYGFDQVNYSGGQPGSVKSQGVTKYSCDQCEYQATQMSSLKRHKMTQHEGIRPPSMAQMNGKTYDCDVCPYQATQLSSLKRHQMAKHSGAQFICDQCEYIGTTNNNLKLHKRSKHEGIRYPCDICGYEATQPGVLNRHKQQKHGFQPSMEPRPQHNHHYNNGGQNGKPFRDPNAPKRPLSGFFHFSNVGRAKVKEANPNFTVGEISKELSQRWHALDEVTKSLFEEMANNDKQRFRREKAEYNMTPKGGYKQTRAKKDPNAPRRPLCGFMCFSNDYRKKAAADCKLINPNAGVGEIGKALGKQWAEAPPEIRDKYNAMATQDKARFQREKSEYQMSPYAGQWRRGMRAKKDPNAPKRNVPGFMWFSHDERGNVRAENPGSRVGDVAKELSRRWALADPETKARYEQMAFADKQRYEKEKHEWHMSQRQKELDKPKEQTGYSTQSQTWQQNGATANGNDVSSSVSPPATVSTSPPAPTTQIPSPPAHHTTTHHPTPPPAAERELLPWH